MRQVERDPLTQLLCSGPNPHVSELILSAVKLEDLLPRPIHTCMICFRDQYTMYNEVMRVSITLSLTLSFVIVSLLPCNWRLSDQLPTEEHKDMRFVTGKMLSVTPPCPLFWSATNNISQLSLSSMSVKIQREQILLTADDRTHTCSLYISIVHALIN